MQTRSIGGTFMRFLEAFADLCIISTYWIVCCVPIITVGASCAALYAAVVRVIRDESGSLTKTFFAVFRETLRQGIVPSLVFAAGCGLFYIYFALGAGSISRSLFIAYWMVVAVLGIIFCGTFVYVFPLLSRFRQKTTVTLRNAFLLAFRYPAKTLGLVCLTALGVLALIHSPLLAFILPGTLALLASFVQEPIFEKHAGEEKS